MKQKYDAPEIKILSYTDIIRTSSEEVDPKEEWWVV